MTWMTRRQAAKYAHMGYPAMIALCKSGEVRSYEHPVSKGRVLVSTEDVDEFIRTRPAKTRRTV